MSYPNRVFATTKSSLLFTTISAATLLIFAAGNARSLHAQGDQSKKSGDLNASIKISGEATAKDLGLPLYPGAKPQKDTKDDSSAANLGLWGNSFGFKLVVLKMESADAPDKVAAFYRKALAKYGPVLDCSNPPASKPSDKSQDEDKSNKLTCGDDKPDPGGQLFKSGSKEKQHIVAVKGSAPGTTFQLLYLEARGGDHEAM